MKRFVQQLTFFILLLQIHISCYAGDLFSTGWGRDFDGSSTGQLFFVSLELFGIWTCMKSLHMACRLANHKEVNYGYLRCATIFLAGCLLYFAHSTCNLIYNSI